jgi:hypothetical protein
VKAGPRPSWANPRRAKPMGASITRRAKPTSARWTLSKGSKPRNRSLPSRPGATASGIPAGETVSGCFRAETDRIPFEGAGSEG